MSANPLSPVRLPVELYRPIIQHIKRRKTLYNILFVSRAFCCEAERALYTRILFQGVWRPSHRLLFDAIASCDRIALVVRDLSLSLNFIEGRSPPEENQWSRLLRRMCNLETLCLENLNNRSTYPPIDLFSGCTFRLRSLVIRSEWTTATTLDNAFLDSQKELVKLELVPFPKVPFSPTIFPKLAILVLRIEDNHTTELISRPSVRALHVEMFSQTLQCPTSKHIKSLRVSYNDAEQFRSTMQTFPSLKFLQLDGVPPETPYQHFRSNLLARDSLLADIACQTGLHKISLQMKYPLSPDEQMSLSKDFFRCLDRLQVLTIQDGLYWNSTCRRWLRDATSEIIARQSGLEWQDEGWD